MSNNNDASNSVLVPVVRNKDGVDVEATMSAVEDLIRQYAEDDASATQAVIQVTENILNDKRYKDVTNITSGALAKMAVGMMGDIPTDKACADAEVRVKAYLQGQPDKFIYIQRGRNAGFHFKDRLSQEALDKLSK